MFNIHLEKLKISTNVRYIVKFVE